VPWQFNRVLCDRTNQSHSSSPNVSRVSHFRWSPYIFSLGQLSTLKVEKKNLFSSLRLLHFVHVGMNSLSKLKRLKHVPPYFLMPGSPTTRANISLQAKFFETSSNPIKYLPSTVLPSNYTVSFISSSRSIRQRNFPEYKCSGDYDLCTDLDP
jgi:hypothetical protein